MLKYDRDEVLREQGQWNWSLETPLRIFEACSYDNLGRPGKRYLLYGLFHLQLSRMLTRFRAILQR